MLASSLIINKLRHQRCPKTPTFAPEDVNDMLREMLNVDLTQLGGVDIEQEQHKAHHWATVGLGRPGYYE